MRELITSFEPEINNKRQKQNKCLIGDQNYLYMDIYDRFPREIRDYLKTCEYNLCVACIYDLVIRRGLTFKQAINAMIRRAKRKGKMQCTR